MYNRLLVDRLGIPCAYYAIFYSAGDGEPEQHGVLRHLTIGRSASIGNVFARVKKKTLEFPCVADCGSHLDEFACEIAEFNDENRSIMYTHPEGLQDDALHAATYAVRLGLLDHRHRFVE